MRILLTGATGFIGSHTARALLADGHEVHALVRSESNLWRLSDIQPSIHFVRGNLLDNMFRLPETTFDLCIHCAWIVEPTDYLETNQNTLHLWAGLRLAKALIESGCQRLLVTGTCFEYDLSDATLTLIRRPILETSRIRPCSLYAKSKNTLFTGLQREQLKLTWARLFYQYGPTENPKRLVPTIIGKLLRGENCRLSHGEQIRDFLHVSDVGSALAALAKSELTGAVNIGSSQPVTVRQIVETIGNLMGRSELLYYGVEPDRPGDPPFVLADTVRLRSTGWEPKFNLTTGLTQTIEWWKTQSTRDK